MSTDLTTPLIDALFDGRRTIVAIAADLGVTLAELAVLSQRHDVLDTLRQLDAITQVRTELLISRRRADAVQRLTELMTDGPGDTPRRACVDLINASTGAFERLTSTTSEQTAPTDLGVAAIRIAAEALEREDAAFDRQSAQLRGTEDDGHAAHGCGTGEDGSGPDGAEDSAAGDQC